MIHSNMCIYYADDTPYSVVGSIAAQQRYSSGQKQVNHL